MIQSVLLSSSGRATQNKQVDVEMFSHWSDSRGQDGAPPPPPPPPPPLSRSGSVVFWCFGAEVPADRV